MTQARINNAGVARVHQMVASLAVPVPWDLTKFVKLVAAQRNKPIRVIPYPGLSNPGHPCGIWIARDRDDIILYDDTTSGYHAEQIILHEVGHLLLDHAAIGEGATDVDLPNDQAPELNAHTAWHVLGRTAFDAEEERNAELFASLILSQQRSRTRGSKLLKTFWDG